MTNYKALACFIAFFCSPIPVPEFISRQIVLDWVEIVEKDDSECAHLGRKSLTHISGPFH